jgi:hypothetical protein
MRFVFRIVFELGRGIEIGFAWVGGPGTDDSDPVKVDGATPCGCARGSWRP